MSELIPNPSPGQLSPDPGYQMYAPTDSYAAAPSPTARLVRYLGFLKRFWWIPLVTLLLSVGAGVAYVLTLPPTFVSVARMWETEKLNLPGGAAFTDDAQSRLGTQLELLQSQKLQQLALARLQSAGTNTIPLDKDGKPLKVKLRLGQAPKSTVFFLEGSSPKGEFSQAFVNALMGEYLDYKKNIRKLVSGDTLASISDQVLRLERDLKNEQETLAAFQKTNTLAILEEEGKVAGGYLARLKTQLSDLELEAKLLEATAMEQDTKGKTNSGAFLADSVRGRDSAANAAGNERQTAYKDLELLKIQREKLAKVFRPKHPKMAKLDADISRGQQLVELYHNQSRDQLDASRQAAQMRMQSVRASIKEWEGKVMSSNDRISEAEHLKQNVARTQSLYDRLVLLLQNVDISRNIDQETLSILEPASPALRTYKQEKSAIGMSVFAGLALGLAIVFLIEMRDDRLTSLVEVTQKLSDNVVGQVPEIPLLPESSPPILEHDDARHMYAESYRSLRSALLFLPLDNGARPKVILITSAQPNEGKSTIAANLSKTLALGGSRVLLIDADLRRGHLHDMLGLHRSPGLADLLREPGGPAVVQSNSVANLSFIARGSAGLSNPGDLFIGPDFEKSISRWRQEYDYIIIDTSPVFAADDATTLAPKVDGTLLVVRNQFSRLRVVREALQLLEQRQARVLGLIYNRANSSSRSYYYYKYGEYNIPEDKKT